MLQSAPKTVIEGGMGGANANRPAASPRAARACAAPASACGMWSLGAIVIAYARTSFTVRTTLSTVKP